MSIFRNRSQHRPSQGRSGEGDDSYEPRLFSGQQPQSDEEWDDIQLPPQARFEKTQIHHYVEEPHRLSRKPQSRTRGPEDRHPRELSFWQEDRFYDERATSRFGSPLRFILVIASLAIIGTFAWLSIRWVTTANEANPPVLYAEPGPYKVRPDHAGGLQVPHQDRLVYNRISPGAAAPPEQLLPAPEQPMTSGLQPQQQPHPQAGYPHQQFHQHPGTAPPPAYAQAPQQAYPPTTPESAPGKPVPVQQRPQQPVYPSYPQQQTAPQPPPQAAPSYYGAPHTGPYQQGPGPQAVLPAPQPVQAPSSPQGKQSRPSPYTHPDHQPLVQENLDDLIEEDIRQTPTKKLAEKPVVRPQTLSNKTYRIQVATLRNKEVAQQELTRIQRTYPELVGKMIPQVEKFNNTGIYRILFGPFSKKENALARCGKFRAQGFSCIVLNPSP